MELLVIIIVLALIFDYINGFHDAANSIATIVSTKVLTPFQAVCKCVKRDVFSKSCGNRITGKRR